MIRLALILFVVVWPARAALEVVETTENISERGLVTRYAVQSSAGNYALNPPSGWAPQIKAGEEILEFLNERHNGALSIQFSTNALPEEGAQVNKWIQKHLPNAEVVEEFPAFVRGLEGRCVDCRYQSAGVEVYRTRFAFFHGVNGNVQFTLSAPESTFAQVQGAWRRLLNSFQAVIAPEHPVTSDQPMRQTIRALSKS